MCTDTIEGIVDSGLCTGCGTCFSICPRNAIMINRSYSKGVYEPVVDHELCNKCSLCKNVCPGNILDLGEMNRLVFTAEPKDRLVGHIVNCYLGYSESYKVRYNGASGGIITEMLLFLLEENIIDGALVVRMSESNPLEPEPIIARSKEEVLSASTSKYCPVSMNIALKDILMLPGQYAVVGLPCHIHGIRKVGIVNPTIKKKIVLHLGIFCGGCPNFLATEYLIERLKIENQKIKQIKYRGQGWPGSMTLRLDKPDQIISIEYEKYYTDIFGSFLSWRCTICNDALAELADLSFGDAWLPELKNIDTIGSSVVVSRNYFADSLLKDMIKKRRISLVLTSVEKIKESQKGCLRFKKENLKSRLIILMFIRKSPFQRNLLVGSAFTIRGFFSGVNLYIRMFLASKRGLWRLLDLYCNFLNYILHIMVYIKKMAISKNNML